MAKLAALATMVILLSAACDDDTPKGGKTDGPTTTDAGGTDAADSAPASDMAGVDRADTGASTDGPAGDTGPTSDTGTPVDQAAGDTMPPNEWIQVCQQFHEAICDKLDECVPLFNELLFGDVETCAKRQGLTCTKAMMAPGSTVTPAQARTCIEALDDTTCEQIFYRNTPMSCRFMGTRAAGLACTDDSQCQSGHCQRPNATMCGMCGMPGGAGADCTEDDDCGQSLICHEDDKKCVAPAGTGMACNDAVPCRVGLRCAGGTCMPQLNTEGADCEEEDDCNNTLGLFCNPFSNKCSEVEVAGPGEDCGLVNNEVVICRNLAECVTAGGALAGKCGPVAGDGQACDENTPCQEPAECIEDVCKIPDPLVCN